MKWFDRFYEKEEHFLQKGKVNLLYGPRRAGKTALILKMLENYKSKVFSGTGDDSSLREVFGSQNKALILGLLTDYEVIFIDEAQRIPDVGWGLKILVDNLPETIIIATGSSSFRLSSEVSEPLTGRSVTNLLYPISLIELAEQWGRMDVYQQIEEFLLFGPYPETLQLLNHQDKISYLQELKSAYLFKDILELDSIRNSDKLLDLLRLLSFQIGNEVSLNELSNALGIAKQTVSRYLDLLENAFIIKKLGGFSKNLRKEVTKSNRYYFYDNGIRNAVINNFNLLTSRNDIGMLWENLMFMERIKSLHYQKVFSNNYFWRTYDQKEVDLVEERNGNLYGYELKWSAKSSKTQKHWLNAYPEASFEIINKENFIPWLINPKSSV